MLSKWPVTRRKTRSQTKSVTQQRWERGRDHLVLECRGVKSRSQASRSQVKEPSRGAKSPGYVSARLHVAAKDQLWPLVTFYESNARIVQQWYSAARLYPTHSSSSSPAPSLWWSWGKLKWQHKFSLPNQSLIVISIKWITNKTYATVFVKDPSKLKPNYICTNTIVPYTFSSKVINRTWSRLWKINRETALDLSMATWSCISQRFDNDLTFSVGSISSQSDESSKDVIIIVCTKLLANRTDAHCNQVVFSSRSHCWSH